MALKRIEAKVLLVFTGSSVKAKNESARLLRGFNVVELWDDSKEYEDWIRADYSLRQSEEIWMGSERY